MAELTPFRQRQEENGYTRQEEIAFSECDRTGAVRMGVLLTKMALFGGYDYNARGLNHDVLMDMGSVFLLSRAAVRVHRRPREREILTIHTWEDGAKGAHWRRMFRFEDESGAVCVSGKSDWILVDPASRKILRPATFTARTPPPCPVEIDCPEPVKLRLSAEGRVDLGTRRIAWSDLDGNGHLFSGRYGDIVWDFLPEDLREAPVREFFINYSREAVYGEDLRLWGVRDAESYRMEGTGQNGVCFTAECRFDREEAHF